MRVLQFVMARREPVRVVEISRELDIESTRAHRLLRTLTALGYLRQVEGRRYRSGSAVPILAGQALQSSGFAERTLPVLESLLKETGMLVAYGLFWERTVTYLFHARPGARLESALAGHEVLPATRSRIGLAVLAGMEDADVAALYRGHDPAPFPSLGKLFAKLRQYREDGYAYDRGFARDEGPPGDEDSLAMTVPGNGDAAVAIGGRIPAKELPDQVARLREAVGLIGGVS